MGLSLQEIRKMPWGRFVMLLQASAGSYEDDGPREATWEEISAWA